MRGDRNSQNSEDLSELLGIHVLRRHWKPFMLALVATPLAAGVAHLLMPATYVSESRVLLKLGREFMGPAVTNGRSSSMYRLNEAINSEVEILSSRELASEVVEHVGIEVLYPEIADDNADHSDVALQKAAATLLKSLSTTGVAESSVIRVAFAHSDQALAQDALGVLMERFQARHLDVFSNRRLPVADEVALSVRQSLSDAEAERALYRKTHGVFDMAVERSILLRRRDAIYSSLEEIRAQRVLLESGANVPGATDSAQREEKDLATLMAEEQQLLENYYPSSHAVKSIRAQIASRGQQRQERLEGQLRSFTADEARWMAALDDVAAGLSALEIHGRALHVLDRSVAFGETRLMEALGTRQEAALEAKLDDRRITSVVVIDRPTLPLEPTGIGLVAKLIVGTLAGGMLGASVVALLHLSGRGREEDWAVADDSGSEERVPLPSVFESVKLPS